MPNLAERYWTAADVRALPEDGVRYECIDGELLVTPAPGAPHHRALRHLFRVLDPYILRYGLGDLVTSPADVEIIPSTLVQPDLFLAIDAAGGIRIESWPDIAHLRLAIEIISPSSARYDRVTKRRFYQRAGVDEYWIVDLEARLIERWRPQDEKPELRFESLEWQPAGAATALVVDLARLFTDVHGAP